MKTLSLLCFSTLLLALASTAFAKIPGDCCVFPLRQASLEPLDGTYTGFGAFNPYVNTKYRLSGVLLAASSGSEVLSVSEGTVVRGPYYFYQSTYAVEIKNSAGPVVRYAFLDSKAAAGIVDGAKVKKGQVIGYAGRLGEWNFSADLRPKYSLVLFEMFTGLGKGPLTQESKKKGIMPRRSDLIDPTDFLKGLTP